MNNEHRYDEYYKFIKSLDQNGSIREEICQHCPRFRNFPFCQYCPNSPYKTGHTDRDYKIGGWLPTKIRKNN